MSEGRHRDTYTDEQKAILNLAEGPMVTANGRVVRIVAGAGTGKMTTLQAFAERLQQHGHVTITYLTYNRTAAADGAARLRGVDCRTFHSQAMKSLELPQNITLGAENMVDELILETFERDIERMLQRIDKTHQNGLYRAERTRLAFFIRRTLDRFTASADSLELGFSSSAWGKTYYLAVKHHQEARHLDANVGDFYTSAARRLYELLLPDKDGEAKAGFTTYDVIMKQAELAQAPIPGSALLMDESQDCSASQILWAEQNRRGKLLVFVGDAVQTIYGFRGAKSENLLNLKGCIDATLTKSFRFGQNLASVANALLFIKENVTTKDWRPYRVTGGARTAGEVFFHEPSLETDLPFTVIAFTNATLLTEAIQIITKAGQAGRPLPKFAINGDGENSGRNRWLGTLKVFDEVVALYLRTSNKISSHEFEGRTLDWNTFANEVFERTLGKFLLAVALVNQYKEGTVAVLQQFREHVIEKNFDKSEADVLLTTVHAAKGQEWDTVVVGNDLLELAKFKVKKDDKAAKDFQSARTATPAKYGFDLPDYGDALNVWYVAVTRAKRRLFLPARLTEVFNAYAHALAAADPSHEDHKDEKTSGIRADIVKPWMSEAERLYPESALLAFVRDPPLEDDADDAESNHIKVENDDGAMRRRPDSAQRAVVRDLAPKEDADEGGDDKGNNDIKIENDDDGPKDALESGKAGSGSQKRRAGQDTFNLDGSPPAKRTRSRARRSRGRRA